MNKIAVAALALAATVTTARSADACRCDTTFCDIVLTPIAVGLGAGIVGGYAYGTGYYIVNDLDGEAESTNYYGSELILHGSLGALFTGATVDAIRDGSTGTALVTGSFAAMHLTLGANGLRGLWETRGQFHPNETVVNWTVGTITGINALYWASAMSERQSRAHGVAEIAINAPFVAGFTYLAKDRFDAGRGGPALAFAGIAAIHGIYVAHGVKTAFMPRAPQLDVLGADFSPTVLTDTRGEPTPGFATAGTF